MSENLTGVLGPRDHRNEVNRSFDLSIVQLARLIEYSLLPLRKRLHSLLSNFLENPIDLILEISHLLLPARDPPLSPFPTQPLSPSPPSPQIEVTDEKPTQMGEVGDSSGGVRKRSHKIDCSEDDDKVFGLDRYQKPDIDQSVGEVERIRKEKPKNGS